MSETRGQPMKDFDGHEDDVVTLRDIKHWMQNMSNNMLTIAKTGEGNRERLEAIEKTLDRAGHEKRLTIVESWIMEMAKKGTVDNYGKLYEEAEKSKEFRTRTLAIWAVVVGSITLISLFLNVMTVVKVFTGK